jgi:hypothetical protein
METCYSGQALWAWYLRIARGEQSPYQRKGKRKNGVLELDHFENRADAVHGLVKIGQTGLANCGNAPFVVILSEAKDLSGV